MQSASKLSVSWSSNKRVSTHKEVGWRVSKFQALPSSPAPAAAVIVTLKDVNGLMEAVHRLPAAAALQHCSTAATPVSIVTIVQTLQNSGIN